MANNEERLLEPSIPSEFVYDALQACISKGFDSKNLIREAGMDPVQLAAPNSRVSVVCYIKLVKLVIRETKDGFLGFLDTNIPIKTFSVLATQIAFCGNIKQMLEHFNRFIQLFSNQLSIKWKEQGANAVVYLDFQETQNYDYRFFYQSVVVVLIRLMGWFVGQKIAINSVSFTFEKTHLDKHLSYLFGCPIDYSQLRNEIRLSSELLSVPCHTTIDQVEVMLRDSRKLMLVNDRVAPFSNQVRKHLIVNRQQGWLSVEEVASRMNISKNLLWRKLKKEKTNFLEIRDEIKRDYAVVLIETTDLRISDVASKLGFADNSAFNKAFIKWMGQTPSAYRQAIGK